MLQQRQFLPLLPVPADEKAPLAVDPIANFRSGGIAVRPDVLLLPSDLAPFAKAADGGVLAVNCGRLTRKQAGGSFASICIHPESSEEIKDEVTGGSVTSPSKAAESVKTEPMDVEITENAERDEKAEATTSEEAGNADQKVVKPEPLAATEFSSGVASRSFVEVARI